MTRTYPYGFSGVQRAPKTTSLPGSNKNGLNIQMAEKMFWSTKMWNFEPYNDSGKQSTLKVLVKNFEKLKTLFEVW